MLYWRSCGQAKDCKVGEVRGLSIPGPAGRLEAALRGVRAPRAAVVLAHPHPLHGGTLHNPVVFHTDRELNRAGLATLRFNFRGVGTSEGEHDFGRSEIQDVAAAASWLSGAAPGVPLFLVGYSFGSVMSIRHAERDDAVAAVVAIGLPVRLGTLGPIVLRQPLAVVQAEGDEFGTPAEVRAHLRASKPEAEIHGVPGTSHLFPGRAPDVAETVVRAVLSLLLVLAD